MSPELEEEKFWFLALAAVNVDTSNGYSNPIIGNFMSITNILGKPRLEVGTVIRGQQR